MRELREREKDPHLLTHLELRELRKRIDVNSLRPAVIIRIFVEEERIPKVLVLCAQKRRRFSLKTVVDILSIITNLPPNYILRRLLTTVLECAL